MAKRSSDQVVSEVPDGVQDLGQEVDQAALTEQAKKPLVPWAAEAVKSIEFHPTLQAVAQIKEKHVALLASTDVTTEEGYKIIKSALRTLTPLRTAVDARRLAETAQAREYQTKVNEAGNRIINALKEVEAPLAKALKDEDERQMQEALAKAKAIEEEQRRKEEERLRLLKEEEDRKKAEAEAELARQRAAIEEEKRKLEAQQAEFNRQQAELRAEAERIRLENERLQREAREKIEAEKRAEEEKRRQEQAKIDAERRAKDEAEREEKRKADAEKARIEYERRVEEAKQRAAQAAIENERARVAREAEAARVKAEKEAAEAAEKSAKAPDRQKAMILADYLNLAVFPDMKSKEGRAVIAKAQTDIFGVIADLKRFNGSK